MGELLAEFPDGYTLALSSFELVKKGWVVPLKDAQNFTGETGLPEALVVASRTTRTISGWKEGDLLFWDVVMVFDDEEVATFAARKTGTMMIYQIETGRVKWLN